MFTINPGASFCLMLDSYPKTHSWNRSTDCCSWDGVYCDEITGQVIELNLTCSQLQGKFHSNNSLFNLSSLKRLDLSYNDFSGSHISPRFGEFSDLTHLDLSGSRFSGQIPSEISHLSKLHFLRIWSFEPGLRLGPHNFKMILKNLTQLRVFDLVFVNISSAFPLHFSSYLTTLRLRKTQLYGILPERVFHLSNLEILDLRYNPQLAVRFPITKWNSSTSLMNLTLSGVNATGKIPESFRYLTSLIDLRMSSCNLSGPIPSNISGLQNLQFFNLSSNYLNGTIPSWIFSLPSLRWLDLSDNHFSGKIQEFKSNSLYYTDLGHNQLKGPIPKSLINQLQMNYLLLSHNNLSGQISSSICNMETLRLLHLGSNNFIGTIPECLGEMSNVWVLDLSNNSLNGTVNTTFSIGNNLVVINLHGNKLEGEVPQSLINCRHLELLDLHNNELNDTFPMWLGMLPNLKILKLTSNKFHGPIKASKNRDLFARLQIMDLSFNEFSGNLPASLFENFQAMKINNKKMGTSMHVIHGYNDYVIITTKGMDREFVHVLSTNIVIDLSRNEFEGYIPSIIGDLIGLRTLNLSHNGFEGPIPTSLQSLSVLESLDFSFNKICGGIPQQLASLTSLAVLNLSYNHLTGCIPSGRQFGTFDNSSYQGNDGLRGFPVSRDCGDDGVAQATTPVVLDDQGEEEDSSMISWQAILMGYGCGLTIGLSIIYIMLSTLNPTWFSRMFHELEHMIIMRIQRHRKRN